ncbi:hypothetical protein [Secundilactobacillus kimchicus]|uniref:hypothetical protein n=1 Tax=Secundilactobacillus kimchicus TaxID=528209 RepID=UPI0024A9CE7C|nr:hypothetical protein [Secundilactobacillus kimchicus]
MKKINTAMFVLGTVLLIVFATPSQVQAATFSNYIKRNTWIRTTDCVQGGYHDLTNFSDRTFTSYSKLSGKYIWRFYKLKRTNKYTYYANVKCSYYANYSPLDKHGNPTKYSKTTPMKIQLKSKNTLWIVPKHVPHLPGKYSGNSTYGANIFKRVH